MNSTKLLQFSKQFGKYCDRRFAPLCAEYGLTIREVNILLFLANNPCYTTARDITEYRGISKSQVSQAVDFLVELGFLTRRADVDDRRLLHLSITAEGQTVTQKALAIQAECGTRLLTGLTPAQQAQLQELLDIVLENGLRLNEEAE